MRFPGAAVTFAVLMTSVAASAVGCSSENRPAPETVTTPDRSVPSATEASDTILVAFGRLDRPVQVAVRVERDGSAEQYEFDPGERVVVTWRQGNIGASSASDLFNQVDAMSFFALAESYDPQARPNGGLYEGDSLTVTVQAGRRTKTVLARPPDFVPRQLDVLSTRVLELAAKLPVLPLPSGYIRAQVVATARMKAIQGDGRIKVTTLDTAAASPPAVWEALAKPGDFVPLDEPFDAAGSGFDAPYGYFFVLRGDQMFEITAYKGR